jgi:hypothetical protein
VRTSGLYFGHIKGKYRFVSGHCDKIRASKLQFQVTQDQTLPKSKGLPLGLDNFFCIETQINKKGLTSATV